MLQSLQIKQQLGTQALSMANQAPQTLLSLFKSYYVVSGPQHEQEVRAAAG